MKEAANSFFSLYVRTKECTVCGPEENPLRNNKNNNSNNKKAHSGSLERGKHISPVDKHSIPVFSLHQQLEMIAVSDDF